VDDVRALGTIVGVWAHPDDEAYLSAGLMAAAVDAGNRVVCVTATRGEHGTSDERTWPPARLARVREAELEASLAELGVREHHWLGYRDGGCAAVPAGPAVAAVRSILDAVDVDTVVTFGPDGMTGHADHVAVGHWATVAAGALEHRPRVLHATKTAGWADRFAFLHALVPVFGPDGPPRTCDEDLTFAIDLSDRLLDRKIASLRAQATQTTALMARFGEATYRSWLARECFVDA
jgi:LmbE family N-acetylglucosaminyl deacetylase